MEFNEVEHSSFFVSYDYFINVSPVPFSFFPLLCSKIIERRESLSVISPHGDKVADIHGDFRVRCILHDAAVCQRFLQSQGRRD